MRELLLLLCRYPFEEKNREPLLKLIREVKDWQKTVELINAHGIIALAAYNIKEAGQEKEIPEDAMAILENGQRQSMVRNLWLTERWKEVNTILNNAGIKHVLLKGMALEHTLYGSKGLRQMNDNDILVKSDDALKAWTLLQQNGFSAELIKSPLHKKIIIEIGKHLPLLRKEGYAVDIHFRLFYELKANTALTGLVDNAKKVMVDGTIGYVLQNNIHVIFLKEHLLADMASGESPLRFYTDIELLEPGSAPTIPASFIEKPKQNANLSQKKHFYRIYLFLISRKHRLRYLVGDIFPSLSWMKKAYNCNGVKALLYYPYRMGKLLWLI